MHCSNLFVSSCIGVRLSCGLICSVKYASNKEKLVHVFLDVHVAEEMDIEMLVHACTPMKIVHTHRHTYMLGLFIGYAGSVFLTRHKIYRAGQEEVSSYCELG